MSTSPEMIRTRASNQIGNLLPAIRRAGGAGLVDRGVRLQPDRSIVASV